MLVVSAADPSRRELALRLLFARFPVEEQAARLRETLLAAERGSLNLDGLLLAAKRESSERASRLAPTNAAPVNEDLPVGAALVMHQSDGIALVWPPIVSCGADDETAVEDALMSELCRLIDATDARLAQALLTPDDVVESKLLERHGFTHGADLFFLARTLEPADAQLVTSGSALEPRLAQHAVTIETWSDDNVERFATVIEKSYQHSLDCPDLKDFRSGAEALASHKLPGVFDPHLWLLFTMDGRDAGLLLLNEHPDQNTIELVYMGVVPELRGKNLGRAMLRHGLQLATQRSRAAMFLAVDCQNRYANAVYAEFSFVELARRRVLLRHRVPSARQ